MRRVRLASAHAFGGSPFGAVSRDVSEPFWRSIPRGESEGRFSNLILCSAAAVFPLHPQCADRVNVEYFEIRSAFNTKKKIKFGRDAAGAPATRYRRDVKSPVGRVGAHANTYCTRDEGPLVEKFWLLNAGRRLFRTSGVRLPDKTRSTMAVIGLTNVILRAETNS